MGLHKPFLYMVYLQLRHLLIYYSLNIYLDMTSHLFPPLSYTKNAPFYPLIM